MAITEYIRNVDRAILNTVFENKVRSVNYVWGLAEDTLNITCNFLYCNHQVHTDILITGYNIMFTVRVCTAAVAKKLLQLAKNSDVVVQFPALNSKT
jgi:hypothetical protein